MPGVAAGAACQTSCRSSCQECRAEHLCFRDDLDTDGFSRRAWVSGRQRIGSPDTSPESNRSRQCSCTQDNWACCLPHAPHDARAGGHRAPVPPSLYWRAVGALGTSTLAVVGTHQRARPRPPSSSLQPDDRATPSPNSSTLCRASMEVDRLFRVHRGSNFYFMARTRLGVGGRTHPR